MPSNLLLLALLAGFLFVHRCDRFRFRAQMLDGYRLLIHSSFAGVVLLALARAAVSLGGLLPALGQYRPEWNRIAPLPYLGTFLLCFPLSFAAAKLWNLFVNADECRRSAILEYGDSLMILMQTAMEEERMISLTLETRKWYAGYLVEAPKLNPNERYFLLIPFLSGYRDPNTLVAKRTLSYFEIQTVPEFELSEFAIAIPLASVRTANLFDPQVYEDYFADDVSPS